METKACCCDEWLRKIRYKDVAVTFTCPEHGKVTPDARSIPPQIVHSSEPQFPRLPPGPRRSVHPRNEIRRIIA